MKTRKMLIWVAIAIFPLLSVAGNLEPSGPPASTMKTLDEIEPRIPIRAADLPLTITEPSSYYLIEDVNFTNDVNNAVTIACDNVTIDLSGYTLKGPDSGTTSGFFMHARSNVEIRNGTVRDFGNPAIYEDSSNSSNHRAINIRALSSGWGIALNGYGHLIKDCIASGNGDRGISIGYGCTVTGNTCYDNEDYGIYVNSGCTVAGNTCYSNNTNGIYAGTGCTVTGNTCYSNGEYGIFTSSGCAVTGNTCYENGERGITASSGCVVTGNSTRNNVTYGIYAISYCLVDQNAAYNNDIDNIYTGTGCETGVNVDPAP